MKDYILNTNLLVPDVNVCTYPQGPRGVGIKQITQDKNIITIIFDDGRENIVTVPEWWFGTKDQYYAMSEEERSKYALHFIEEGYEE